MSNKDYQTFEDILAKAGETPEQFAKRTENDSVDERGYKKVKLIAMVLNGDSKDNIFYPWFWRKEDKSHPSGLGLSFDDTDFDCSNTCVASRLKYKDRSTAAYAGEQFIKEYTEYLLG